MKREDKFTQKIRRLSSKQVSLSGLRFVSKHNNKMFWKFHRRKYYPKWKPEAANLEVKS